MKITRREIRDSAFKLIFEKLFRDELVEELYDIAEEIDEIIINEQVKWLVEGTLEKSEELDGIISQYSQKRSIDRIPRVSIAILRIAFFEIMYDDKTPVNAAINEAVLLSQQYSSDEDVKFVNGVLGSYSRASVNGEENA